MTQLTTRAAVLAVATMLTLKQLHAALIEREIAISYPTLSEFIGTGDIARQLHVGGTGNRKEFHPETVEVLATFLPKFRETKGVTKDAAPALLRQFLRQWEGEGSTEAALAPLQATPSRRDTQFVETPNALQIAAAQGRAQGLAMTEEILTAKQGAALLSVSVSLFRKTEAVRRLAVRFGTSASGDRWRKSDLLSL